MGIILKSKMLPDNRIKLKICLDEDEALFLKGCIRDIRVFSSDLCTQESCITERGKNGVTKYFKIPSKLRNRKKKKFFDIKCQRIESGNKVMFVYLVSHEKNKLF